ncbi:MAG: peptidase [Rhodospirillales bacterium]
MKVQFTQLQDGTAEEFIHLRRGREKLEEPPAAVLLKMLQSQTWRDEDYPVTLMRHQLQTATRALRDGADEEITVAALFHDVSDRLLPGDHAAVAAGLLAPYVSERTRWIIHHHAIFQLAYYADLAPETRALREQHKDSPYYADTVYFCERWDQAAFDPAYEEEPLETFVPLVERVIGPRA